MIVPTKRFWILAALGIPLASLGIFIPGFEWVLLPYNLIIFGALAATYTAAKGWKFLSVQREVDPILSVRVPNLVRIRVNNNSDSPFPFKIIDEPPIGSKATKHQFSGIVPAEGSSHFSYTVTPYERGADAFRGTFIRFPAPLGLCEVQQEMPNEEPVRIYPNVLAIREYEMLKQRGRLDLMGVRRSRIKGLGQEFRSLRDYNEDDYRLIDWKASARRGKLVVKEFEQERNQGLIVMIDAGRHMLGEVNGVRKIDYALDAGLMLMHSAERQGDQIGLLVFNDLVQRWISPRKGRAQVASILDAIHALEAQPVESDPARATGYLTSKWTKRSLVVVFTDAETEAQGKGLAVALSSLAKRHLVMVVRVSDPRLREMKSMPLNTAHDVYLKAASAIYAEERAKASRALFTSGLENLESEPEELSAKLVSAYLRVKELNLI